MKPLKAAPLARRTPLYIGVAAALAYSTSACAAGITWPVTECSDSAPGSLRSYIAVPTTMSGDTLEVSCSTITLAAGATSITVNQNNLTIQKTGGGPLTIDGSALQGGETGTDNSRIFTHTQAGTLTLKHVNLTGGHVYHAAAIARGGCLYSKGGVELIDSSVSSCTATSNAPIQDKLRASGGGIFAQGAVMLTGSTVSGNTAMSSYIAEGGGVFSNGVFQATQSTLGNNQAIAVYSARGGAIDAYHAPATLISSILRGNAARSPAGAAYGGALYVSDIRARYSTISGNSVSGTNGFDRGGALFSQGSITLRKSTVSDNHSTSAMGGISAYTDKPNNSNTLSLIESTVSGNSAESLVGGIATNSATTKIYNSTIAFNTAAGGGANGKAYGPGLALKAASAAMNVTLQGSLFSDNTFPGGEFDVTTAAAPLFSITFNAGPAHNFIRAFVTLPSVLPDAPQPDACPLLGPLRDNGGPTKTHALLSSSPAIDAGNNVLDFAHDQRGFESELQPNPYPRVSNLLPDIGAYEVDQAEIVFDAGVDGCGFLS